MTAVRAESTGWRDEWISRRHREYGIDVPATDVDFLLIEYDRAQPIALVEYKRTDDFSTSDASRRTLAKLATRAGIPAIVVRYYTDGETPWKVYPLNRYARAKITSREFPVYVSESQWIEFLYWIRDRDVPDEIGQRFERARSEVT